MATASKDSRLQTRSARERLKIRNMPYWTEISQGVHLGYRKGAKAGSWYWRCYIGNQRYHQAFLAAADDHLDSDSHDVLTYYQAQATARDAYRRFRKIGHAGEALTVADAAERYLAWYRDHRKAYRETEHALRVHILASLGEQKLASLTATQIRNWLEKVAAQPARVRTSKFATEQKHSKKPQSDDEKRARRASANRVLNILKALLNRAFHESLVADDTAWRQVKPFPKVNEPRIRFLNDAEGRRLINACPPDLRQLVQAALLTGTRFGELVSMQVQDVSVSTSKIYIARSKSERPRHIPINPEGVRLFGELITGKIGDALVFTKKNGASWGKNHHVRALLEACKVAKITPAVSFHDLRHTYASHLAQAGVDLLTINKLLGHADTRITSKHYAHLIDQTLAHAVTKLPSFGTLVPRKQIQAIG